MLPNIWFQQAGMEHAGSHHFLLEVRPNPFLCMSVKLQMCETNPAPSIASLKKTYSSLKPSGYKLLCL